MNKLKQNFIQFLISEKILNFGNFITKAGRVSPYFFNTGLFNTGAALNKVAGFYMRALQASNLKFEMLFGSAYKGIPLTTALAMKLFSSYGLNISFAYNRKEIKNHGEGGNIIGATLKGKIVIVDDVISAGTSIYESLNIIRVAGAIPVGVLIALDRMERSGIDNNLSSYSTVQEISKNHHIPVIAISDLNDVLEYLAFNTDKNMHMEKYRTAIKIYRMRYGI